METFELVKLFDKLIDRCIQVVQERDKQRIKYLNENIEPTFIAFERVHFGYIETFVGVMDILDKFGDSNDFGYWETIVRRLERDSAVTNTNKIKFRNFAVDLNERATHEFINAVIHYLGIIEDKANRGQHTIVSKSTKSREKATVRIQFGLKIGKEVIAGGDAKQLTRVVRKLITDKLDELNDAYEEVDRCYRIARLHFTG